MERRPVVAVMERKNDEETLMIDCRMAKESSNSKKREQMPEMDVFAFRQNLFRAVDARS